MSVQADKPTVQASPGDCADDPSYRNFFAHVRRAQLASWLPVSPSRLLDISDDGGASARVMAAAGHEVVPVAAGMLGRVDGESADGVVAEERALSLTLYTESALAEIARVLRPGGRLLLSVESTVAGLAQLARNGRWPELADAPSADVVLVPYEDGVIRRCFWPDELHDALTDVGLRVEWIRPRTLLSPATVVAALADDARRLPELVRMEMELAGQHGVHEAWGRSGGSHLLAAAHRPER